MERHDPLLPVLEQMPKIELHVHLEGAIREETYIDLASRNGGTPDPVHVMRLNSMEPYSGLPAFVTTMRAICDTCLRTASDYGRITYEFLRGQARQNIVYTEFSYDPSRSRRLGIDMEAMMAAVDDARQQAEQDFGTRAGIIIGLGREHGAALAATLARKAVACKKYGIVGLDLHGNEEAADSSEFQEAYDLARNAGLGLRAHVGESTGPESIRRAVDILGVSRVAHGISAIRDPSVIALLKDQDVMLDMCPTSNYMLSLVSDLTRHPIRSLYDQGVKVSVSTDDPLFFYTNLIREYSILMNAMGFTLDDLLQMNRDALAASFAPPEVKRAVEAKLLAYQVPEIKSPDF
jgi:adenosine deaminase